ncbi:response regulator transcription factor [Streptomyces rapamycinicus]|uniref:Alkaline phosphatase n=2 Tax=Streptomyces rapamycinicus TaxID=1226757 RepID=A0A0A0NTI0_STRRN|nr:response regulator transcription factor [Streptomyces rapamycinicus]AGP59763.1 alkaline phosphatase [Streptomyces rapamycinicus NRRL 5491]MBB4789081.1 two-component system OmpR family response regulator [Streptomyces rapamycinicus]RLV77051.1 alkaline phosphatase [Streptomyces rapamycinicus NRRL 5491]UTO67448.1 response regulator transcription factor [Streptomyces rapamycinicus]UTP35402.1 response regulator transcription factor [Streptomyces rapamycinicus NRRL 5491]
MTAPERLLVVEDEPTLRELLSASLRLAGFAVVAVATGEEALAAVRERRPDLIVLDVMLPDIDGFEVVHRLRGQHPLAAAGHPPVLFLTARDAPEDRISGLRAGGDDYVTKPFNLEELVLRIRAILRRVSGRQSDGRLVVGELELDPDSHQVILGGQPVRLSPTEFGLLRVLMENAGQVLSKSQLLELVWQYDFGGDDSIVASYISYLRRKVDLGEPKLIHTVRGTGYVLRRPPR